MPDPVSAAVAGVAGIGSGIANIFGAQSAAQAQQQAAQQANAALLQQQQQGLSAQKGYFDQTTGALAGIAGQGGAAYSALNAAIPGLTAPITMDQKTLEATPGYQFNLSQGERGVQLGGAALGLSGAQAKAAATYATGLADSTYQNQFKNANTNKQNAFNFLYNTAGIGANAAGQYAAAGTSAGNADVTNSSQVGQGLAQNYTNSGQAQAAADIATGKQAGNIFGSAASMFGSNNSSNPFGMYNTGNVTGNSNAVGVGTDAQYNNWALQNGLTPADI